ncbi:S8 family serine peptidase [Streptomyces mirabilis]|uniref:S8 family serine peptidase n=1 Tax=Streptomyces mirabilis TaxID=68239 RepID=UPI0033FEF3AA
MDRQSQSGGRRPRAGPQPSAGRRLRPCQDARRSGRGGRRQPRACGPRSPADPSLGPAGHRLRPARRTTARRQPRHRHRPLRPARAGPAGAHPGGGYQPFSGTSAAAPFVTGTAALLWSTAPDLSAARIRAALCLPGMARRSIVPPLLNASASLRALGRAA